MPCPRCGTPNPAEAHFCARCGQALDPGLEATAADPPTFSPSSDRQPSSSSSGWLTSSDLLRMLLRKQWLAAAAFALIFALLDFLEALTGVQPMLDALVTILIFGVFAVAVLRWGLTTLTVGVMVTELLLMLPATADPAAWWVGSAMLVLDVPLGACHVGVLDDGSRA